MTHVPFFSFQILIVKEGFLLEISRVLREPLLWDAHCHAAGMIRNLAAGSQVNVSLYLPGDGGVTGGQGGPCV